MFIFADHHAGAPQHLTMRITVLSKYPWVITSETNYKHLLEQIYFCTLVNFFFIHCFEMEQLNVRSVSLKTV